MFHVEGLTHHFFKQAPVLDNICLKVRAGEIVGLLGPNGAGKTTAFMLMVGLLPIQKGKITLDNDDISHWNIVERSRRGLIYLPQDSTLFGHLSVRKNMLSVLEFHQKCHSEREKILHHVSHQLQMHHLLPRIAGQLSGGEKRRVEIARALTLFPRVLLLDEPFSGIDPIAITEVKTIVRELAQARIGVLITDHNVRETLQVCQRAYLVNQGKIIVSGTPQEFSQSTMARKYYLGDTFEL